MARGSVARDGRRFAEALAAGMSRLLRFLEAGRIDVGAVAQRALRKRLASAAKR